MPEPTRAHPFERVTLTAQIPEEPPEGSIVLAYNERGQAWERRWTGIKRNRYVWQAAGDYHVDDGSGDLVRDPMRWEHLIGQFGAVYVVRWGNGETEATDA